MSILKLDNVKYTYKTQYQTVNAVRGVSYEFEAGKVYAVMGKSGSGKTTLLSLMAGLDLPTEGQVIYNGEPTEKINLEKYRRSDAAVIYQNFRLFPLLTVAENIMFPMELNGTSARKARKKVDALVDRVGLPASAIDRYPTMLSGGEQQRVAIARALGMNTKLILADEPTGNLDTANSENIVNILLGLAHDDGYCVIIVTHDEEIGKVADELIRLTDGVIEKA